MHSSSLGTRSSADQMLAEFEVDCGDLVPGHRFLARGLSTRAVLHPTDLVALADDRPEPPPDVDVNGIWFENFVFPVDSEFADADRSREALAWRRMQRHRDILALARRVPAVALHYELVPVVRADELDEDGYFEYSVKIEYRADRPVDWEGDDEDDVDFAEGGTRVQGSSPLPDAARVLTFTITGLDAGGVPLDTPNGTLVVDLKSKSATWVPANADLPGASD